MSDRTESPAEELAHDSIGFVDALVIGLNATSPAYSLAAVIGPIVALVGVAAPGVLLASFVPMLLIASAFYYLNKVDQDCGTTFSWVTRAMGPWWGWQGGWAITMTGAVALVFLMTALCVIGTEVSARVQNVLIVLQVLALIVFAGVALVRVATDNATAGAITPSLSWLNPFAAGGAALTGGLLLGVFAYWGWESAVNLTEETEDSASAPGKAGILSTVLLLGTYIAVAYAIVAYVGTDFLAANAEEEEFIFGLIATEVMGGWDWVVLFSVMTSAIASTQTTIIPASRTALSMARRKALPRTFGHIHPRFRTPDVSTWWVAVIACAWYVVINLISENASSTR